MNRIVLFLLMVAVATTCAVEVFGGQADDFFPVSLWGGLLGADSLRTGKGVIRRQYGEDASFSKIPSHWYEYLNFYDCLGYKTLVFPSEIERMWRWGHDPSRSKYFFVDPETLEVDPAPFRQIVADTVGRVVDNLGHHPGLLGWALWDEPDGNHCKLVRDTGDTIFGEYEDFYYSLFLYCDTLGHLVMNASGDTLGWPLDSASVFSTIVQQFHEQDTNLVFDDLMGGWEDGHQRDDWWWRRVASLKTHDGSPNPIDCMGTMKQPIRPADSVGNAARFRFAAALYDSVARADSIRGDGRIHFWPYLQGCGFSARVGEGSMWYRMLTAEELRLMTSLALQHHAKGLLYWRAGPWIHESADESDTSYYAGFFDEEFVPFDAPYEEYVYVRNHSWYGDPDDLHPFKNYFDPFSDTLDTKPDTLTEDYYLWKYEPYGRRFNALKDITAAVHRTKHWLMGLWKRRHQAVEISPLGVDPNNLTDAPSIMAMTDSVWGDSIMGSTWAYYVNRDFHPDYAPLPCSVSVGVWWPEGAGGSLDTVLLDYSGRRLRSWRNDGVSGSGTGQVTWIGFKTRLGAGDGELVQALITDDLPPRDFVVTQPDISFHPPDTVLPDTVRSWLGPFPDTLLDFTVRDTVRLMADIYNLGFTGADSVTVIFYDGDPRDTIEIGSDNVSLSALSDTLPEVDRAFVDWILPDTSYGAHDIHVVVNHHYEYTDNQVIRRYFHISEADSNNNHAHLPLYIFPLDYATEELNNPWDMDEDSTLTWRTPDIDTVWGEVLEPDSISGVCELRISGGYPSEPDSMCIYLRVGATEHYIDPDEYYIFRARIYADDPCSLQVFWYDAHDEQKRLPKLPPYVALAEDKWNLVRQDLSQSTWGETVSVDEFGFMIRGRQTDRIRISWVKLTRE